MERRKWYSILLLYVKVLAQIFPQTYFMSIKIISFDFVDLKNLFYSILLHKMTYFNFSPSGRQARTSNLPNWRRVSSFPAKVELHVTSTLKWCTSTRNPRRPSRPCTLRPAHPTGCPAWRETRYTTLEASTKGTRPIHSVCATANSRMTAVLDPVTTPILKWVVDCCFKTTYAWEAGRTFWCGVLLFFLILFLSWLFLCTFFQFV